MVLLIPAQTALAHTSHDNPNSWLSGTAPKGDALSEAIDAVNATGYGLTLGVHSRIDATQEQIHNGIHAGNTYVNRNIIGAVVGVQPFGGQGLSGTGPKAGGPRYLHRFAVERSRSINTTAAGGNAALMSMDA